MKNDNNIRRFFGVFLAVFALMIFLLPDFAEARRGGSFGGSRGGSRSSFKSSRSFSAPKSTQSSRPSSSFGSSRKSSSLFSKDGRSSFGGTSMSRQQAQAKYGTPRRVVNQSYKNDAGGYSNYRMNDYGGYSSGLMHGYMMGQTSWMWAMPFHPAFYYSRPAYVYNSDGTVDVYPPTFSFFKLIVALFVLAIIVLIIRAVLRARKKMSQSYSSGSFN